MIIVLIILSEITLKFCQRLELGVISRYSLGYGHIPCRCARLALPAQDILYFYATSDNRINGSGSLTRSVTASLCLTGVMTHKMSCMPDFSKI